MRGQPGFFDIDDRLKRLSDLGDQLEAFRSAVDLELFRPELNAALSYADRTEGGAATVRSSADVQDPCH
jgi:transposase, IS5 family